MKIRTQLIVAFLVLAVLPMAVIVLFNYVSSQRAVRQAVEAEAAQLTADMESRMQRVHGEASQRIERLGARPFRRLAEMPETEWVERQEIYGSLVGGLGETAVLMDSFEFVPAAPEAVEETEEALPAAPALPRRPARTSVIIEMREVMREVEEDLRHVESDSAREEMRTRAEEGLAAAAMAMRMMHEKAPWLEGEETATEWQADIRIAEQEGESLEIAQSSEAEEEAGVPEVSAAGVEHEGDFSTFSVDFEPDLKIPVWEEGRVVGEVKARVKGEEMLRWVLGRTVRSQGEVPFAVDADGELFTLDEQDREALAGLPISGRVFDQVLDNWVVVTTEVPGTGLSFGIARPIRESLEEIRVTAIRNFGFGTGLIGLALLGVLPLSRRLSRNVQEVTAAAKRVAHGDLSTRLPVRSKSEIGQLATAFNRMAEDLSVNQERLIEEERTRRDSEVEKTLMQSELDRQAVELEEARRFQLSLLPKELPQHDSFELAVEMRTATEVGGDYYDFQLSDEGVLTAAIGDATGHGARAGTMVTVIKSLFSAHPPGESLAGFLSDAGGAIRRMQLGRMAMALALARLEGSTLTLAAAGMPPVLLCRESTGRVEEIAFAGMPLGSFATGYSERSLKVAPGDTVLIMTDGLPELPNPDGEPLGYLRAAEAFERHSEQPLGGVIEALCDAAESWSGGGAPADDVTFVVLRVK